MSASELRPKHIGHALQWVRSIAAVLQVVVFLLVLLRVYGVV